ncbi:MAG: AmmeMemoRadiSam system protein B [Phycisphaeraceae bacterium]
MPLHGAIDKPVHVRPTAVAGRFYPGDPETLKRDLARYLEQATTPEDIVLSDPSRPLRAIIAPHAGYIYSAPIAATAYRFVAEMKDQISRVVLIGPAHYVPFTGLAGSSASAFMTPLCPVPVDVETTRCLADAGLIQIHDGAHAPEHALEVHLPFLVQTLCPKPKTRFACFSILPLLFGDVGYEATAKVLSPLIDDPHTLIVVSSDLSHYHDYKTARAIDRETAKAIVSRRPEALTPDQACGCTAIRALLVLAKARDLEVTLVDLRNSGDTAGPHDRVVGYGAFIVR